MLDAMKNAIGVIGGVAIGIAVIEVSFPIGFYIWCSVWNKRHLNS